MRSGPCRVYVKNGVRLSSVVEVTKTTSKIDDATIAAELEVHRTKEKDHIYSGIGSSWSSIEEFAMLGIVPSHGRRVGPKGNGSFSE